MRVGLVSLALGMALTGSAGAQEGSETLFLSAEKVLVRPGEVLENAAVLVQDGRIVAVGVGLTAPEGAREISGAVICAGFLDPWSSFGVETGSYGDGKTSAATRTVDGLDPFLDERLTRDVLRGGVTSLRAQVGSLSKVRGLGALVRLSPGDPVEENVLLESCCLEIRVGVGVPSRTTDVFARVADVQRVASLVRDGLSYLEDKIEYRHELEEWQKNIEEKEEELEDDFKKAKKARDKAVDEAEEKGKEHKEKKYKEDKKPKAPRFDQDKEVLAQVADGAIPLIVEAHRSAELRELLEATESFDRLRLLIAGGTEALSVADELARRRIPVIVHPTPRGKGGPDHLQGSDLALAGQLHEAGVPVLIGSGGGRDLGARDLSLLAAMAVGHGLDPEAAFGALTIGGARALDVGDRIGTVERGKDADLLVLDGDPLSTSTRVLFAITGGEVAATQED